MSLETVIQFAYLAPVVVACLWFSVRPDWWRVPVLLCGLAGLSLLGVELGHYSDLRSAFIVFVGMAYFSLAFVFFTSAHRSYPTEFALTVGWEDFKIPVFEWQWAHADKRAFINVLGVPVWRPLGYWRVLIDSVVVDLSRSITRERESLDNLAGRNRVYLLGCRLKGDPEPCVERDDSQCFLAFTSADERLGLYGIVVPGPIRIVWRNKKNPSAGVKLYHTERFGRTTNLTPGALYDLSGALRRVKVSEGTELPALMVQTLVPHRGGYAYKIQVLWVAMLTVLIVGLGSLLLPAIDPGFLPKLVPVVASNGKPSRERPILDAASAQRLVGLWQRSGEVGYLSPGDFSVVRDASDRLRFIPCVRREVSTLFCDPPMLEGAGAIYLALGRGALTTEFLSSNFVPTGGRTFKYRLVIEPGEGDTLTVTLCMLQGDSPKDWQCGDAAQARRSALSEGGPIPDFEAGRLSTRSRAQVRSLQRSLYDRGFDPGVIDGVLGTNTRRALIAYRERNPVAVAAGGG